MKTGTGFALAAVFAACSSASAHSAELRPMPVVKAPFAGKSVGTCARQPLRFTAYEVTAARGENMEFNAKKRRGDSPLMKGEGWE